MAFWSGLGGYVVVTTPTTNSTRLDVSKWTLRKTSRLVENTNSGSVATNFEAVVPNYEWTIEVPWDSVNIPDTNVGLVEGAKVTIQFFTGASGLSQILVDTSVESNEEVDDDANDIIRETISGKGGYLSLRE